MDPFTVDRRRLLLAGAAVLAPASSLQAADDGADNERWRAIRKSLFGNRPISEDARGIISLEAPLRAADAAVVPIAMRAQLAQTPGRYIRKLMLVVDKNPSPVGATFSFTPDSGRADVETRVRVEEYSHVRAIAELNDGSLVMQVRFIKAAGGCSAPSLKDKDQAMARLGRMQLKPMTPWEPGVPNRLQLLVSHPNYTGMQIDQLSRNWIPPDYVRTIKVRYGDQPVLEAETDISIAEDPAIGFSFVPTAPGTISVEVEDSQGRRFTRDWPVGPTS